MTPYRKTHEAKELEKEQEKGIRAQRIALHANRLNRAIRDAAKSRYIKISERQARDFLDGFEQLCDDGTSAGPVDAERFASFMEQYRDWPEMDVTRLMTIVWRHRTGSVSPNSARLVESFSHAGWAEATVILMQSVWLNSRHGIHVFRHDWAVAAHRRLRTIVQEGQNFRAMALEAHILNILGKPDAAIGLFERAMEGILAANRPFVPHESTADDLVLSSPWLDLASLYVRRLDRGYAKGDPAQDLLRVLRIGREQDDPNAFFISANQVWAEHGMPTSEWLYYITKAAASGIPQAANQLAEFYAGQKWKFLADEPPDHLKPTPYDSYPAPLASGRASIWTQLLQQLGLSPTHIGLADCPHWAYFRGPLFPSEGKQRYALALLWFQVAFAVKWAPSLLSLALTHLEKNIDTRMSVPRNAIQLEDSRFSFESKEAYAEGQGEWETEKHKAPKSHTTPNPHYRPRAAKLCLELVFDALSVYKWVVQRERKGPEPANRIRWDTDRSVFDSWTKNADSLEVNARKVCDDNGWNIYDANEALLYRHTPTRGSETAPPQ